MTSDIPAIISAFQCCVCGSDNKRWFSTNRTHHPFDSPGNLTCMDCGARFPVEDGYLNLQVGPEEPVVPFQKLMQMKAPVAVYEGIWRPLGYFIASKHSFPRDLDRIANLIQRPNRVVLDLAAGPGNVTRRLARLMPDSTIVGFDLSSVMLGRAVRLTREEGLKNIYYMRGSALSLPFKDETFDAVSCCGALQLFPQAIGEISRVLKPGGEFVCQTTIGPRKAPAYVRAADRVLKFSWFYLDDLKDRLSSFNFNLISEERSYINYIFLASKAVEASPG
jgi:SAM-dependent methyltransferase